MNEKDNINFNIMLQLLIEGYLKKKNQPDLKSSLEKAKLEYKPGVLYGFHIELLQLLMEEELQILGLKLKDVVAKNGEEFKLGQLSEFERRYLTNKINNLSGVINFIKDKEKNK